MAYCLCFWYFLHHQKDCLRHAEVTKQAFIWKKVSRFIPEERPEFVGPNRYLSTFVQLPFASIVSGKQINREELR